VGTHLDAFKHFGTLGLTGITLTMMSYGLIASLHFLARIAQADLAAAAQARCADCAHRRAPTSASSPR